MADWNDRDDRWRDERWRDRDREGGDRQITGRDFMTNQPRMSSNDEGSPRGMHRGDEHGRQNRDWDRDSDRMTWAGGGAGAYDRHRNAESEPWGAADYRSGSEYRGQGGGQWNDNWQRPRTADRWGGGNMNWGREDNDSGRNREMWGGGSRDWGRSERENWNRDRERGQNEQDRWSGSSMNWGGRDQERNRNDWNAREREGWQGRGSAGEWNQGAYGARDRGGEWGGGAWDQQRHHDQSGWDRDRNRGWEAMGRDRSWSGAGTSGWSSPDRDRERWAGGYSGFDSQRDWGRDRERNWNDRDRNWADNDRTGGESWTDKVANFFGVGPKNWTRSDDRIREEVSEALEQDPRVDASNIEVQVQNGDVTLTGHVPQRYMKRWAEDVVERCRGVKDVHNQLRASQDMGRNRTTNAGTGATASTASALDNQPDVGSIAAPGAPGVAMTGGLGTTGSVPSSSSTDRDRKDAQSNPSRTGTRRDPAA